jgi:hypothetical protein
MTYAPNNVQGPFLQGSDFFSLTETDLRTRLTTMYSRIANSVNAKEIAIYDLSEIINGQMFYNKKDIQTLRPAFRRVFNFGAIASGATLSVAHNISGIVQFTFIGGCCTTNVPDFRPIPFASASAVGFQIEAKATATNYIIINGTAGSAPAITSGFITLEYLKN